MSHVKKKLIIKFLIFLILDKVVKQVDGGSAISGATLSSKISHIKICSVSWCVLHINQHQNEAFINLL